MLYLQKTTMAGAASGAAGGASPVTLPVQASKKVASRGTRSIKRHVRLDGMSKAEPSTRAFRCVCGQGWSNNCKQRGYTNTNMGVGMLALPAAMSNAGLLGGSALLLMSMAIAAFGSHLLAECVAVVGRPASLSTITSKALGSPGIILTDAAVIVISTSCAIGYLIVVGDMLPEVAAWILGEDAVSDGQLLAAPGVWISPCCR